MPYYPAEFSSLAGTAEIRIKAARPGGALGFLWLWFAGWTLGGLSAISSVLQPRASESNTFLKFWLLGWVVGEAAALRQLLWYYMGEELISVANGTLRIQQRTGGLSREKTYDNAHIYALRAQDAVPENSLFRQRRRSSWLGEGAVLFDYGAQTVAFGLNLPAEEGQRIVEFLHRHHVGAAGR